MALNNYSNLKASIEDWSHRNDVGTLIDDFIDIAEAEMFKHLKLRDMEVRATDTASTSSRDLSLPTGFISMRRMRLTSGSNSYDVGYKTPESMQVQSTSGRPRFFTITDQIEFDRTPDSAYSVEMQHSAGLTALSASNTTNAALTRFPMLYLYGSLWALHTWARDEETAEYYYNKFQQEIATANKKDRKGRYGPAPTMRIEGPTP